MPELPEVQTIVDDLNKKILKLKIKEIDIRLKKIVKNQASVFKKILTGSSFKAVRRRAKFLIFEPAAKNLFLVAHLRMTGQIIYRNKNKTTAGGHSDKQDIINLPNKHTHLIIRFENGSVLFYNDLRQFGYWKLTDKNELEKMLYAYGIEPLSDGFTLKKLQELIKDKKTNIKQFLLNQKYIAGLGNIYVDEVLFDSGILPTRTVNSLTGKETEKLYKAIKKILKKAIKKRGTTFNDYRDADGKKGNFLKFLKVYQRDGEKCYCCKNTIKKTKLGGRGTRYCPICQK